MTFSESLKRHCARAVPIVLVDNAIDELATVADILNSVKFEGDSGQDLLYVWSQSNGLQASGNSVKFAAAERYLQEAAKGEPANGFTNNPYSALLVVNKLVNSVREAGKSERCGFVFYMGDRVLRQSDNDSYGLCIQAIMDMRDTLKFNQSTMYLVGIDFDVPKELKEHIVILQAELPSDDHYNKVVDVCYSKYREARELVLGKTNEFRDYKLSPKDKELFVESLKGMSAFAAEQTVYLSTDMNGMHVSEMRQRAIQTINSTRGLSVHHGDGRGFSVVGGLDSIKSYASRLTNGKLKPKLIVYADEVDKTIAGSSGGDTSGISQNFLGTWLSEMQDTNALGMLLTGVYGAGKSEFAKRWGEEAGVLTIHLDLAGMKDSLVGNSEANLRRAMNVIKSIGGTDGGIIYLATCNRIGQLPPEFKRRFNLGTFFFYFPDEKEKAVIWDIYRKKYGIPSTDLISVTTDKNWTGAEIESCCRLAYLMGCTLEEAATRIVPVATTAREEIDKLVDEATGRFLSCSHSGVFQRPSKAGSSETKERKLFN